MGTDLRVGRTWWVLAVLVLAGIACGPLGQGAAQPTVFVPPTPTESGGGLPPAPTEAPTELAAQPTATLDLNNANVQLTGVAQMTGVAATAAAAPAGSLEQWANVAVASSQYGTTDWSASRATGAPDSSEGCGDNVNAWASSTGSSENDFIQLVYTTAVVPTRIDIYEQNKPGSIVQVEVVDEAGQSQVVYQGLPNPNAQCPRVFKIGVTGITAKINTVIIRFNQSFLNSYDEIDAVNLVGNP